MTYDIVALAKRKTYLQARLQAIAISNVYGKSIDELTAMQVDKIDTERELNVIEGQIRHYILSGTQEVKQ